MVWMLVNRTCGSSAVGYPGPLLIHLTVQDGVDVRYCTCGSSAVGYLGPFFTHLTVQDGADVFEVPVGHGWTSPDLNRNLDEVFYAYTV